MLTTEFIGPICFAKGQFANDITYSFTVVPVLKRESQYHNV